MMMMKMKWVPCFLSQPPPQTAQFFLLPHPKLHYHYTTLPPSTLLLRPQCFSSSLSPLQHMDDHLGVLDDHVIGDCLVFEDGAFDDPFLARNDAALEGTSKRRRRRKMRRNEVEEGEGEGENLVPEEWKEVQAEINMSKKQKKKIAREIEFNSRVERKSGAYQPLRSINLEEYESFREAKRAQLDPLGLDSPAQFENGEKGWGVEVKEEEEDEEEKDEDEEEVKLEDSGIGRVAPRNPKWEVYGKGFADVKRFFESSDYAAADKRPQGGPSRKLFTPEEKTLLNRKAPDLVAASSNKWLPLHSFAASGESELVALLLKRGIDINAVDTDGLTALHRAIMAKKLALARYLLKESANPFVVDEDGATLMHYAVLTASTSIIKLLLLYNVDVNSEDKDGWTPLHVAVQARRTDVLKLLLVRGADRTIKNQEGLTPLELCLYSGRDVRTYEMIKLLKIYPRKKTALAGAPPRKALASGRPRNATQRGDKNGCLELIDSCFNRATSYYYPKA